MSEFKGTPGKWHVDETGDIVSGPYNVCIPYATKPEDKVLMAAAPDLLHALRCLASNAKCLSAFETDMRYSVGNTNYHCLMESVEQADAAIAKALQP